MNLAEKREARKCCRSKEDGINRKDRLRDELLNRELFTSVWEAQVLTEDYRQEYNQR